MAIAREVPRPVTLPIVELGGGTGAVTRALLDAGIPRDKLIVVELEEVFHRMLVARFPGVRVLQGDARELAALLRRHGIERVGAIVSGLPLAAMPRAMVRGIVEESLGVLGPGAPFIQFTYTWMSPISRSRHGLRGGLTQRVFVNFPPASVWVYRREADVAAALAG
jgi:phosphatidylethanolamine/phosphatidyl-N-methylethanolamine N-methyltransferase